MAEVMGRGFSAPSEAEGGDILEEEGAIPKEWESIYKEVGHFAGRELKNAPFGDIRAEIRRVETCLKNDAIALIRKN